MKIALLTEDNINCLTTGRYAIFSEDGLLEDLIDFEQQFDDKVQWRCHFTDIYNEYGGYNLDSMKRMFSTSNLVPIAWVKNPMHVYGDSKPKLFVSHCEG